MDQQPSTRPFSMAEKFARPPAVSPINAPAAASPLPPTDPKTISDDLRGIVPELPKRKSRQHTIFAHLISHLATAIDSGDMAATLKRFVQLRRAMAETAMVEPAAAKLKAVLEHVGILPGLNLTHDLPAYKVPTAAPVIFRARD